MERSQLDTNSQLTDQDGEDEEWLIVLFFPLEWVMQQYFEFVQTKISINNVDLLLFCKLKNIFTAAGVIISLHKQGTFNLWTDSYYIESL